MIGLSFCHVVSFFDFWADFSPEATSIHSNLLFLALRKLMNLSICEQVTVRVCLCAHSMVAWVYVRECMRRAASVRVCEGATLSWLFQISVPHGSAKRGSQEGERESDGEIMEMEGERRLTQSLMSFLGSLCLFLGQGPLAEDVGGLRTTEQKRADQAKVC